MSESTQENTEQNPFTRPGFIISAALVLAIIAAALIIFLIPKGTPQAEPDATTTPPAPTSSSTATSSAEESICGLPSSDSTALGAAPKTTWVLSGGMAVPSDPATAGPGTTSSNGLKSCFAHSPTGALYAAANIWATSFYGDAKLVYKDLAAEGPTRDAALKAIAAGNDVGGGDAPKMQIQGFIVRSYSPKAAVVDLAMKTETGALGSLSASLVWEKGDWKLELPAAGGSPFKQISDLGSYIPWAPESDVAEDTSCNWFDLICSGKSAAEDAVAELGDDAIANLGKAIMEGLSQMVTTLSTFWVTMPTTNLSTPDGVSPSPTVAFLDNELAPWTLALAVLSVIIGGMRMVWEQRGAPLKDLLRSLLTLTLVSGMGLAVIAILVTAADAFSTAIIETATEGQGFAAAIKKIAVIHESDAVFILIVLGLIGLLTSLVQIVLMIVRGGMLVILAGILPTTAAFTNTEMGRQWFQKAVGWTIAFILYKPAAAIVYAAAFRLMDSSAGKDALVGSITGFALMIVAVLALPALMRFVTPMVGAVAAGSGGGAAGAAAMGAVATGAVSLGRSGSGRGNASPTPPSSPSTSAVGERGSTGASKTGQGSSGANAKPTPGAAARPGSTGAAASPAAGIAGVSGSSGAVAGPVGLAASTGVKLATRAGEAAQKTAQDSTGEGPSGSNQH